MAVISRLVGEPQMDAPEDLHTTQPILMVSTACTANQQEVAQVAMSSVVLGMVGTIGMATIQHRMVVLYHSS